MTRNRIISSLVIVGVLAASVSTTARADDHRHHHHHRANQAAIAAGILGAVVVGSLIANAQPAYAAPQPYYAPQSYPSYEAAPQAYYPPQPVQQVYYAPSQPYYAPQPVTVIVERHRDRHGYREHQQRHPH